MTDEEILDTLNTFGNAVGLALAAIITSKPASIDEACALLEVLEAELSTSKDLEHRPMAVHIDSIIGGLNSAAARSS